ncbi:MAG: NAD-binding protein [Thiolinea sp.]
MIIAGFGRFGQIVGRMLISNGIPVTVMDRSPSQIEQVRQFGFKVFYGDVSREELLHAAGAHKAKLLIITVGNRDSVDRIIETAQRHFPHLKIYTRAYDVLHYHRLKNRKVDHIERELFHSSLKMGEQCLQGLGMRAYQARRAAVEFARHDERVTAKIGEHIDDSNRIFPPRRRRRNASCCRLTCWNVASMMITMPGMPLATIKSGAQKN